MLGLIVLILLAVLVVKAGLWIMFLPFMLLGSLFRPFHHPFMMGPHHGPMGPMHHGPGPMGPMF